MTLDAKQPQLFVLISTGQNVANLPPVLQRHQRGDSVVWIESKEAKERKWKEGASKVLSDKYGLVELPSIFVAHLNYPSEVIQACAPLVAGVRDRFRCVYLVGNGGTKFTPIGLLKAWDAVNPVLLYGDDKPAGWTAFTQGIEAPPETGVYEPGRQIQLEDILETSGYQLFGNPPVPIWPASLPPDIENERYGQDRNYTIRLAEDHFKLAVGKGTRNKDGRPNYDALVQLIPAKLQQWKRNSAPIAGLNDRDLNQLEPYRSVYNGVLNLANAACAAAKQSREGLLCPDKIGAALERAVARRVHHWLNAIQPTFVSSAWMNVCVARKGILHSAAAQFDVLLVLTNGVLRHIECKAAEMDAKDLDARVLNLQRAGSSLARMTLCLPLFTEYTSEPWFADAHRRYCDLKNKGNAVVPFTLDGQPARYSMAGVSGTPEHFDCPSLEQALEELPREYRFPVNQT